jgi:hypothetical protein
MEPYERRLEAQFEWYRGYVYARLKNKSSWGDFFMLFVNFKEAQIC